MLKQIKEKINKILTEMMATSSSRDWIGEAHKNKQEIAEIRNALENEILNCSDQLLELFSQEKQKLVEEILKEIEHIIKLYKKNDFLLDKEILGHLYRAIKLKEK